MDLGGVAPVGRTGDWFACEASGVRPDIVILGKALGGGLPLSAVVARADVLDAAPAIALFTTAGNAVSTAAGLAVIRSIEERDLRSNARTGGERLRTMLDQLAARHRLSATSAGAA
jgi:4-aminobutyrate aminotransferase